MTPITVVSSATTQAVQVLSRASQGVPGLSSYQVAKLAGYSGTQAEWVALVESAAPAATQAQDSQQQAQASASAAVQSASQSAAAALAAAEDRQLTLQQAGLAAEAAQQAAEQAVIASAVMPAFAALATDLIRTQTIIITHHGFN